MTNPQARAEFSKNRKPQSNQLEEVLPEGMVAILLDEKLNPIMKAPGQPLKARVCATPWSIDGVEPETVLLRGKSRTDDGLYTHAQPFSWPARQLQAHKFIAPCEP